MTSRIIAVANQKGGVGKTTLTLGLAAAVANSGRRVLVIDMDPQSNASQTLLADYDELVGSDDFFTSNDILEASAQPEDIFDAVRRADWPGVDLIPAEQALANRDAEGATGIELRLRRMLKGLSAAAEPYDVVLLDCPPSVGRLTVNALLAAKEIVLVSCPDRYGHNALTQIEVTLQTIRDSFEHDIEVAGLVVNMFEATTEATTRAAELSERYGGRVLGTMRKRTVISVAAGANASVFAMRRADAVEVAGWFTDIARTLRAIGAREQVPMTEATEPGEVEPSEDSEASAAEAVGY